MKTQHTETYDIEKAVLRGKFIGINAYIKQQERPQIGILSLHLKEVEKEAGLGSH